MHRFPITLSGTSVWLFMRSAIQVLYRKDYYHDFSQIYDQCSLYVDEKGRKLFPGSTIAKIGRV